MIQNVSRPVDSDDPLDWVRFYWERDVEGNPDAFLTMASVMRLHQISMKVEKATLKSVKLNPRSYLFLMTLVLSEDGARLLSRLSDYLMTHPTTVTVLADQLEARKLVVRAPHPTDRRAMYCHVTPEGRELANKATELLREVKFGLDGLDDATMTKLLGDLGKVRRAVGDTEKRSEGLAS